MYVLKACWMVALFVLTAGIGGPAYAACTVSTPNDCHIGSAALEVNLGPLPIDHYGDHNNNNGTLHPGDPGWIPTHNCATSKSVRKCIIDILKDYKAQGVTGVRFQFALGAPGLSTAFDTDGNVNRKWLNNLQLFFSDLARNVGIRNITPTPVLSDDWSAGANYYSISTKTSCGVSKQLRFIKWLPFGIREDNKFSDCQGDNNAYNSANPNDVNFWGWDKFFTLMDSVLARASSQGLNVKELDVQNELDIYNFTVQARLIYDGYRSVDVLGQLRSQMTKYYGTGADTRVTYSVQMDNPSSDGYDCGSVYGDSAIIIFQSEVTAAFAGGLIGGPSSPDHSNGLVCGGGTTDMLDFEPSYSQQPAIHDVHAYVIGSATARKLYDGLWSFLDYRDFESHLTIIGEANPVPDTTCDGFDKARAYDSVNGFNGYSGTSSTLYQNAASNTTIRPWQNNQHTLSCWLIPNDITPPYNP